MGLRFRLRYESSNVSHWHYGSGACGGSFSTSNGAITSPSYPDNYPDHAICIYTISQPNDTVIQLNFLSFILKDSSVSTCNYYDDNLEIRDGPLHESPLLARLCGSTIPAQIQSSQNQLWMK